MVPVFAGRGQTQDMSSSCDRSGAEGARGRGRGRWFRWRGRGRGVGWRGGRGRERTQSYGKGGPSGESSNSRPAAPLVQTTLAPCPYPAWPKYLPNEVYSSSSQSARFVSVFTDYFQAHLHQYDPEELESKGSLPLDYTGIIADPSLSSAIPDLPDVIRNQPEATLNQMALALHTVLCTSLAGLAETTSGGRAEESALDESMDTGLRTPRLYIRLHNFQPVIPLKSIKAPQYGKCVSVQGTVVRVSNIKPLVTTMAFKCLLCQEIQTVALPDGKYQVPTKCPTLECRGRTFTPLRSSPLTQTIDWQTIRVQEISGDDRRETGRIPRTIECELTADLVDSCVPGDMVTITAVVKATGSEEVGRGRNARDKCMFLLYLQAISVSNSKASAADASHGLHMDFSTKDYYAIQEIQSDKNVFRLIVGSLCPTICGHEMVKAGLVLGLFGGSQKFVNSKNNIPVRGDPHILIVGDPGLGKSQMLQAAANITPRGVYVCGNTTTTSGLTVTLTKEGGSGDYALEAGALVLADQDSGMLLECESHRDVCPILYNNSDILLYRDPSNGALQHPGYIRCIAPDFRVTLDAVGEPSEGMQVVKDNNGSAWWITVELNCAINSTVTVNSWRSGEYSPDPPLYFNVLVLDQPTTSGSPVSMSTTQGLPSGTGSAASNTTTATSDKWRITSIVFTAVVILSCMLNVVLGVALCCVTCKTKGRPCHDVENVNELATHHSATASPADVSVIKRELLDTTIEEGQVDNQQPGADGELGDHN